MPGLNNLLRLSGNLYLTDLFDILIIALFFYSIFILFQRTRTYLIFIGSLLIIVLYLLAKNFNLYLTSLFLQYFVGVAIIIFVIIFQSEIRKFFELLGLLGTRRIRVEKISVKSPSVSEIFQACVKMAQNKTGALIVLRGQDNLEYLMTTGVTADSVISEELILSVFDPHSPGHDGAMIIENNRISKIGVHLPLSKNYKVLKGYGTRHTAALGLSEQSDALVIVVSEERGKITLCREGKLKSLDDYSDLDKELDKYIKNRFDHKQHGFIKSLFTHNPWLKSSAILSAVMLWLLTAYQAGILENEFNIPVSFIDQDSEVIIESYSPKEITLVVSGRGGAAFSDTTATDFKIEVDASVLTDGVNSLVLDQNDITLPKNLSLVSFQPDTVLLTAQKYLPMQIPITVQTQGDIQVGYNLNKITVTPSFVDLWVPATSTPPAEIFTESIDVGSLDSSTVLTMPLILPDFVKLLKGEPFANVALTIEKQP